MGEIQIRPWSISFAGPVSEYTQSVFTIGNGFIGLRGFSLQEPKLHPYDHAMFRAGLFEYVKPGITDMVQLPDVLGLRIRGVKPERVYQELDLKTGVFHQRWQSGTLCVEARRMASMADRQLLCVCLNVKAIADTDVCFDNVMESEVSNLPVNDDQTVEATETVRLLEAVSRTENELVMQTVHGKRTLRFQYICSAPAGVHLKAGESICVEKRVRILLDDEKPNPEADDPWRNNAAAWEAIWRDCDILLDADERIQGAVRYNIFQLLCSCAEGDRRVSIGARGLTHGRYKGNTFWDTDVFLLPFYCWQRPQAAKALVQYRYDRLDDARELAQKQNLQGARYPWMCASDGKEQCESWDIGFCETHVTADVSYAVQRYVEITGDEAFLPMAKEIWLETARYWKSRFAWEEGKQKYSSFFVKGPDEYCGAAVNNMYTNLLAQHNARLALANSIMAEEEREELSHFAEHIAMLYDEKRSLYLQDELFERLEPLPPTRRDGEPLYRTICFDRMQRYRALKQADLVQLMTMLPTQFSREQKQAVWDAYEPLTVHDSSLSFGSHALLAFRLGLQEKAWSYFERSLLLDLEDGLRNTGREGIHMAALGISWQALVFGALGLWSENGELVIQPQLPPEIRSLSTVVHHRGERFRIAAQGSQAVITKEE